MTLAHYIFRIDDVCPTMHWENFSRLERIFKHYNIKPIIGVIPDNQDSKLQIFPETAQFWQTIKALVTESDWVVAQHGYQHTYVNTNGGILNINQKSEFAGLPYEEQYQKLKEGKELLEARLEGSVSWFMAPGHSFDHVTCQALVSLGFSHLTDGMALAPFQESSITWVPQQLWKPRYRPIGLFTICLHPDTMKSKDFDAIEAFLSRYAKRCISQVHNLSPSAFHFRRLSTLWWNAKFTIYKFLFKKI